MGINSRIVFDGFQTDLIQRQIDEAFEQFKVAQDEYTRSHLEIYGFRVMAEDDWVEFIMPDGDYIARHYADRELAKFVSKIIRPGTRTHMQFESDFCERWGWAIERDNIIPLVFEDPFVDGVPLSDWEEGKGI